MTAVEEIDRYLAGLPEGPKAALTTVRAAVKAIVPEAVETFGYGMPGFRFKGRPLVAYAAWAKHCALYGMVPDAHRELVAGYSTSRGTIRFTPERPLPPAVFETLIRDRMEANEGAEAARKRKEAPARARGRAT